MGVSVRDTCVKHAEGRRDEIHHAKPTGPPHNAATTKEDPPTRTGGVGDR
jgi:hypothetical protein